MIERMPDESVHAFFEAFCAAFATFDGEAVARLYHVPHVALRGDGSVHCIQAAEDVARFFQDALDRYHEQGCRRCRFRDLHVVSIGERSVLATVTWELLDAGDAMRLSWRQSYNLIDVKGPWQVLTSTEHLSR